MRQTAHPQLIAAARLLEPNLATRATEAMNHLKRLRDLSDGYPSNTLGDGGSRGTSDDTSVERAVSALNEVDRGYSALQAAIAGVPDALTALARACDAAFRVHGVSAVGPEPAYKRCNGIVNPACTDMAGEHRDPETGGTISDMCSRCFMAACPRCRVRATDQRRVDDVLVCEACYRRHLRAHVAA